MRGVVLILVVLLLLLTVFLVLRKTEADVVIGPKNFPESYLLGEIMAQLLEDRDIQVERRFGLGGTLIGFEALRVHSIDLYVEYSGTLEQAILKSPQPMSYPALRDTLRREYGMDLLEPLGFDNTYALALRRENVERRGLKTISDLTKCPDLRYGFTHDFLNRRDGWSGLARAYGLNARPSGIEHGLSYPAIRDGDLDVTDAYVTDGDIDKFALVLLEDDRQYFPKYLAAPLLRGGLDGRIAAILGELTGMIPDGEMKALNAWIGDKDRRATFAEVARHFLRDKGLLLGTADTNPSSKWSALRSRVVRHLQLTLLALVAGIAVAIPLGIVVYRFRL
ncbi:MAG TPA: glycine betaine ABC transporter substrate-binding protein, partial [Gemmataceae bacterium]